MYMEDAQGKSGNPLVFRLQEILEVSEDQGLVIEQDVTNFRYVNNYSTPRGKFRSLQILNES